MTSAHRVRVTCDDASHDLPRRVAWFELEPVPPELLAHPNMANDSPRWWITAATAGVNVFPATRAQLEHDLARHNLRGIPLRFRPRGAGYRLRCRCGIDVRLRAETLEPALVRCADAGVSELRLSTLAAMFE